MRISVEEQKRMFEHHLQIQCTCPSIQKSSEKPSWRSRGWRNWRRKIHKNICCISRNCSERTLNVCSIRYVVVEAETKKYKDKECSFEDLMSVYEQAKEYYVNVSYALKTYDRQYYK